MYIRIDKETRFYTGEYSQTNSIVSTDTIEAVRFDSLPNSGNYFKDLAHKLIMQDNTKTVSIHDYDEVQAEEDGELKFEEDGVTPVMTKVYKYDDNNQPIYITKEVTVSELTWVYDEDKYNEIIGLIQPTELTDRERIEALEKENAAIKAENAEMKEQLTATNSTVESIMTEIIPNIEGKSL